MTEPTKFYFHLAVIEIVYQLDTEIMLKKVQFFSKSDTPNFPARRLNQIQNTAALQIKEAAAQEGHKDFKALEATILAIHPLGHMTDVEFYGDDVPSSEPDQQEQPEAAPETAKDNVTSIR